VIEFERTVADLIRRIAEALERQVAQQDEETARRLQARADERARQHQEQELALQQNAALLAKMDETNKAREEMRELCVMFDRRLKALERVETETVQ
jgi:hypothetical protein